MTSVRPAIALVILLRRIMTLRTAGVPIRRVLRKWIRITPRLTSNYCRGNRPEPTVTRVVEGIVSNKAFPARVPSLITRGTAADWGCFGLPTTDRQSPSSGSVTIISQDTDFFYEF